MILSEILINQIVLRDDSMKLARKSEIANLHCTVLHDEQVGRLDVAVHDSRRVHILEPAEEIEHYSIDVPLC